MAVPYFPKVVKPTSTKLLKLAENHPYMVDVPLITRAQLDAGSTEAIFDFSIAHAGKESGEELRDAIKCLGVFFRRECRYGTFGITDEHFDSDDFRILFTHIKDYDAPVPITGFLLLAKNISFRHEKVWQLCAGYLLPNNRKCGKMRDMIREAMRNIDFCFVQSPISPSMMAVLNKHGARKWGETVYLGTLPKEKRSRGVL